MRKINESLIIGLVLILLVIINIGVFELQKSINIVRVEDLVEQSEILSQEELSNKLIRFHVIANSDSVYDQEVKREVRDRILSKVSSSFEISSNIQETRKIIENMEADIRIISEDVLKQNNLSYGVKVILDKFKFPTKYYGSFSLPAGEYEALRIVLGEGKGQNWWCVLFPPLCMVNLRSKEIELDNEDFQEVNVKEEFNLIEKNKEVEEENKKDKIVIKWKMLELLGLQ